MDNFPLSIGNDLRFGLKKPGALINAPGLILHQVELPHGGNLSTKSAIASSQRVGRVAPSPVPGPFPTAPPLRQIIIPDRSEHLNGHGILDGVGRMFRVPGYAPTISGVDLMLLPAKRKNNLSRYQKAGLFVGVSMAGKNRFLG